ncbi:hypothetical protein HYU14_03555 [Candidatus Woesearchaeota archaeon]|nr:hypothetical protein [Candidatus Woesearchaeota archaeon]
MHPKPHQLEKSIDALIPWTILVLLAIIIGDIFYIDQIRSYHLEDWVKALDAGIIIVFVFDLAFKYRRVKNIPLFLKKYWLDIIAVFPFALFFRAFEGLFNLFMTERALESSQLIFHEGLEIERGAGKIAEEAEKLEKEIVKIVKEAEEAGRVSRSSRFSRIIRPLARSSRLLKFHQRLRQAFTFYEKPSGRRYAGEKRKY